MPIPRCLVLVLLAALAATSSCSSGASPPASATPPASKPPPATRTVVEFGPDEMAVAVVERVGSDARASVRTVAGPLGQEIHLGDDHYVRMAAGDVVLGVDRWIHIDLSDPVQRRYHEANPAGFIDLAALAHRGVGDEVAGFEVLEVRRPGRGVTILDLGEDRTVEVRTETVRQGDVVPISAPDRDLVVALDELPELIAGTG